LRGGGFLNGLKQRLSVASPFNGTIQFTGLAACATIQMNSYHFHKKPLASFLNILLWDKRDTAKANFAV
jgi:hypothetical protein